VRAPRALPPRVLALTPGDLAPRAFDAFLASLRRAVEAGLEGVLLREPDLSDRDTERLARGIAAALAPRAGWLGIHDRVHLARALDADAAHLGFRSLAPEVARELLAPGQALGLSAHARDDRRAWKGADYLFFGPLHETPSKRGLEEPVGKAGLARALEGTEIPIWAIGGIDPERAAEALAAGARGVAVRAALLGSADPAAAWRRFATRLAPGAGAGAPR